MALLALLAVIVLSASWLLVSQLNAESGRIEAARKLRNAEVLNRAKLALIGYVAAQAVKAYEDRPGALPCPEAAGYFDNPTQDGQVAGSCSLPKVGRFPWRTIGTDKLVDAYGEPLWYVVSPGWAYTSGTGPVINSNTAGQLTVDGVANDAVALIIAPGPAITVSASATCSAWTQTRLTTGNPDWRNYLECENADYPNPDSSFVTRSTNKTFNDQVAKITVAEIMPAIEAAVANRIEREIVPALNTVYTPSVWGFAGSVPLYPYAAPFTSATLGSGPGPGINTSKYRGEAGTYQGLLPFNQTQNCTESAADPRCTTSNTDFLVYSKPVNDEPASSSSLRTQSTCSWQSTAYVCTGEYQDPPIAITVTIKVTDVARGLRAFDASKISFTAKNNAGGGNPTQTVSHTETLVLNSDGSATITIAGSALPSTSAMGWGGFANYVISVDRTTIGDHSLLSTTDSLTGWFARNEWFRLIHYATVPKHTAAQLPSALGCTTGTDCLSVANMTPGNNKRALLIFAGRSLNGVARPTTTLSDYLEFGNAAFNYEKWPIANQVLGTYADTGFPNAYVVAAAPATIGRAFQVRAANANTGASTLMTTATGSQSLVNADGSALAASQIQANSPFEVVYDGTRFLLHKRPFNDRIIILGSN